jgi:transglutaminase-like putative cysteine protease
MAIHVALRHQTRCAYDRPVSLSPHVIRLRPAPHCRTAVLSYSLGVEPQQHFINWQQDPHGNYLARVVFPEKTRGLVVDVELVAEMSVRNPFNAFEAEGRRLARFAAIGHTHGPMTVREEARNPAAPLTLDLRRPPAPSAIDRHVLGL